MRRLIIIVGAAALLMGCIVTRLFAPIDGIPVTPSPGQPTYTSLPPSSGVATWTPNLSPTKLIPSPTLTDALTLPVPTETETLVINVPSPAPFPTLVPVIGVYLAFERGFMVYIEGANCLYAYANGIIIPADLHGTMSSLYHYCLEFDVLPDEANGTPESPFGRVWRRYVDVRAALGNAVGSPLRYETVIPPPEPVIMGGVFNTPVIRLPDGRDLYCGTRSATAGTCTLSPRSA